LELTDRSNIFGEFFRQKKFLRRAKLIFFSFEMAKDWKALASKIDRGIRRGEGRQARESLLKATEKIPPREWLADFANLAWRASDPALGIRLLNPIVRPAERKPKEASEKERAEYGICLVKIGAVREGEALLAALSLPEALLYRAFALVARWDYRGSIPLLEKYLASPRLSKYQSFVGQVNLAAALVEEGVQPQATYLLRELTHDLHLHGHALLLGRVLLLSAENFMHRRDWKQAASFLERAERLLQQSESLDHFLIRKFRVINEFLKKPGPGTLSCLRELRLEAADWKHWETIRDCDRTEALATADTALLHHLYFGTPHAAFRERLVRLSAKKLSLPNRYAWKLGRGKGPCLSLASGRAGGTELKVGQALHRLCAALASDFYRPLRTTELHALVFPDEFFHPIHSPQKMRRLLTRLRQFFSESGLPLEVGESDGSYRLTAKGPCTIEVAAPGKPVERGNALVERLRERYGETVFSAGDAASLWGVSSRTARRHLDDAQNEGAIEALGRGKARRYRLSGRSSTRQAG
jgi:hypothetical protein